MRLKYGVIVLILMLTFGCVTVQSGRKTSAKVEGQAGRALPGVGLSIDANYDSRLDQVIPGFILLPVSIKNISLRALPMDAKEDRWIIIGEKGQKYKAVNSLRLKDPVTWRETPDRIRDMIDYPEVVPINYSVTFDLLLPKNAKLKYFSKIRYYNAALRQEFVLEKEY